MDTDRLRIDRRQPTPAYRQLRNQLAAALDRGDPAPGEALPSERELAARLRTSRRTVRRAVEELIGEQRLERRHGAGTFVLPPRHEQRVDRLVGFVDEAVALGFTPGSRLLEVIEVPADRGTARQLGIAPGTPVPRVTRVRTADGRPLALQLAHLAPSLRDLPLDRLGGGSSLYALVASHAGVTPRRARQTVRARLPNYMESRLLEIDERVPVLALDRTTYDAEGRPFEFVRSAYRSDSYRMVLDLLAPERHVNSTDRLRQADDPDPHRARRS